MGKTKLPTHIDLFKGKDALCDVGLAKDSVILLEQIRTLDKQRLKEKMGHLDDDIMLKVNDAITVSFGLSAPEPVKTIVITKQPPKMPLPHKKIPSRHDGIVGIYIAFCDRSGNFRSVTFCILFYIKLFFAV